MITTFPNIIAFSLLGLLLVLGTVLRSQLKPLQIGLVPASLIGGLIGFIFFAIFDIPALESLNFGAFTFHFFTLSFISLALMGGGVQKEEKSTGLLQGSTWLTSLWIMSLMLQAGIGLAVILGYNAILGSETNPLLGVMATHGFTQGPGQAIAIGSFWEQDFNVENAVSVGLIYATLGFIVSVLVGVPFARWAIKRGMTVNPKVNLGEEFLRGFYNRDTHISTGRHVTHPSTVDTIAWHASIIGIIYLITHVFLLGLAGWIGDGELFGIKVQIFASHNLFFVYGLFIALMVRRSLKALNWHHVIDNETQKRITGTSADFMMVAMLMSIQLSAVIELVLPILIITVLVTLVTAVLCFGLGRKLADYKIERAITSFGTCTGSAGSSLLLLRIVDPDFSTPVSRELALFNVTATLGTIHIWAIFAPILPSVGAFVAIAIYLATFIGAGLLYLSLKIRKEQKDA